MNNVTILLNFLAAMGLIVGFSEYYCNNYFHTYIIFQNINIIMFENWQGISPMGLSASLADYKRQYLTNMEMLPTFLKLKTKKSRDRTNGTLFPLGFCAPWYKYFINSQINYQNIDNKTNIIFCWKYLDQSLNNCEGLTKWALCSLGQHLPIQLQNWIIWGTPLNPINALTATGKIK